jgi:RNA polymerase sigma factor (sigma-70 family)
VAVGEGAVRVALTKPAEDDATAFAQLVKPELPGAYRLAGYLLRDETEAEDAAQEAVERAWQSWAQLRDADRFGAWFGRIVTNVCQDRLRARRGAVVIEINVSVAEKLHERDAFRDALARDEVGRLVRTLPPDQQVVVAWRFWRDLSLDEIAERLDVPLGTVKSRLHYAMRALRKELERQGKVAR